MPHRPAQQKTALSLAFTRHGALDSGWLAKLGGHQYSRHRIGNPHARSAHGFPSSRERSCLHIFLAAGKSLGRRQLWRRGGVAQRPDERVLNRSSENAHSDQPEIPSALNSDCVKWDGKCGESPDLRQRATAESIHAWESACREASAEREKFIPILKTVPPALFPIPPTVVVP